MKLAIQIISIIFAMVALCLLMLSLSFIIKTILSLFRKDDEPKVIIEESLKKLSENVAPEEKADIIGLLIQLKYITVHTLQNKGNNYDDKRQTELYCKSLTKPTVSALFELEAKDGGYSF